MRRGAIVTATIATLLTGACTSEGKLEVRALASTPSAKVMPVPQRIAEAEGQLALGNVALALESYRKASREQPDSVQALLGMAACYDMMRRHDLSRRYYEDALALAPANTDILTRFAGSLEQQGEQAEAAEVRREIGRRMVAAARSASAVDAAPSVTLALPLAPAAADTVEPPPPAAADTVEPPPPAAAVTVALPFLEPARSVRQGPRIERLSMGEVVLVTSGPPQWKRPRATPQANSPTLAQAGPRIRLLNAARHAGLAARTRAVLAQRGWRGMVTGDAAEVRRDSVVLYPAARRATAQKLAAQFGFPMAPRASGSDIVMLLGRDAAVGRGARVR